MDPPPPLPSLLVSSAADSTSSSPRSRNDSAAPWDDHHHPLGSKLRLMCSYGGHIIPRPHDKSLCYVGGDTRIVVADRHASLADLHLRLSHTLLNGRHFTLKYQLPNEDLDSLISLSTDEDLENMIEEYDRTAASSLKPSPRLRLFLFPSIPETAASMGSLLDDAKSETWFVDALNGSGLLPRGLSESAAMDALLELDHGLAKSDSSTDLASTKQDPAKQEVVVDSLPVVETSSSFGSSSSSPSMANLPPIKVRGDDYNVMVGLNEKFSTHLGIAPIAAFVRSDRVIGDDEKSEKSDHGTVAATGLRKPPLPLQPVQRKLVDIHNLPSPDSKHAAGYNLPSPDSVASDCSMASGGSLSKHAIYHDPTPTQPPSQDPIQNQQQQQPSDPPPQFVPSAHYIHHHHNHNHNQSAPLPVSSYYPMYVHHQMQHTDQQYPLYLLQPQPQPSFDRPLTPPPYTPKPTDVVPHQMVVQVPAQQFQQHYIGLHQMPSPSMNNAVAASAGGGGGGGNYGYEYSHHLQDQAYYAPVAASTAAPPMPQYQTMTPATAVMYSQASTQIPLENNSQQSRSVEK